MVALHVSIQKMAEPGRFSVRSDNLRREDATDEEIAVANMLEQANAQFSQAIFDKVVSFKQTQDGPLAESKED